MPMGPAARRLDPPSRRRQRDGEVETHWTHPNDSIRLPPVKNKIANLAHTEVYVGKATVVYVGKATVVWAPDKPSKTNNMPHTGWWWRSYWVGAILSLTAGPTTTMLTGFRNWSPHSNG
jgi:hypothetical protein